MPCHLHGVTIINNNNKSFPPLAKRCLTPFSELSSFPSYWSLQAWHGVSNTGIHWPNRWPAVWHSSSFIDLLIFISCSSLHAFLSSGPTLCWVAEWPFLSLSGCCKHQFPQWYPSLLLSDFLYPFLSCLRICWIYSVSLNVPSLNLHCRFTTTVHFYNAIICFWFFSCIYHITPLMTTWGYFAKRFAPFQVTKTWLASPSSKRCYFEMD